MSDSFSSSDTAPGASRVALTDLRVDDHVTFVALAGDLDVDSARVIELAFTARTAARHRPVVVDIAQLKFISSYGIGIFVACAKACSRRKHPFVLVAPQPHIHEALAALRLEALLLIEPTADAALKRVGA